MATPRNYWAITNIGWGRGTSPATAARNYYRAIARDYPDASLNELLGAWGTIWEAPDGATGFILGDVPSDTGIAWETPDGGYSPDDGTIVGSVGDVTDRANETVRTATNYRPV